MVSGDLGPQEIEKFMNVLKDAILHVTLTAAEAKGRSTTLGQPGSEHDTPTLTDCKHKSYFTSPSV